VAPIYSTNSFVQTILDIPGHIVQAGIQGPEPCALLAHGVDQERFCPLRLGHASPRGESKAKRSPLRCSRWELGWLLVPSLERSGSHTQAPFWVLAEPWRGYGRKAGRGKSRGTLPQRPRKESPKTWGRGVFPRVRSTRRRGWNLCPGGLMLGLPSATRRNSARSLIPRSLALRCLHGGRCWTRTSDFRRVKTAL
jgi:hypothetical protein